jgi:DNA-binding transcriptional LysR family regulator
VTAAVDGFGLTRLLSYQVADQLRDGQLKTVLTDFEPAALPVHLVHREGRHASSKARAFLDLAIERLRANRALN